MDLLSGLATTIVIVILAMGGFFVARRLILWYFRIPELIEVLSEIRDRLPRKT